MSDDARAFFDAIARRYDRAYAPDARTTRERVARVATYFAPGARLLDLGVGTGRELSLLQDLGFRPTGVDLSKEMLERCARRARPVPLVEADFWEPLPFDAASFDGVLALHGTLAHPPSLEAYAALGAEIARLLAPGDLVTGASITAFIPDEARWSALFAPALDVHVEPIDVDTIVVTARVAGARSLGAK
jgi:SAM-dependent methyltransferase